MAGGRGYFWQGLGKSFEGYRDQQFKKEAMDKEFGLDMSKAALGFDMAGADRASREKIAGIQLKGQKGATQMGGYGTALNSFNDFSFGLSKKAAEIEANAEMMGKPTPSIVAKMRLQAQEYAEIGQDIAIGNMNVKFRPRTPVVNPVDELKQALATLRAAKAK